MEFNKFKSYEVQLTPNFSLQKHLLILRGSEFAIHKSKVKIMEENEAPKNQMTNEAT
jgi:hypothetical protein